MGLPVATVGRFRPNKSGRSAKHSAGPVRMKRPAFSFWLIGPILYASLIGLFPWSILRVGDFRDLENYSARLRAISRYGSDYYDMGSGILAYFSNEIVWYWILVKSIDFGVSSQAFFVGISVISAFVSAVFLFRKSEKLLLLLFLVNPISLDLYLSQIRSALAFSLVLVGILYWQKWVRADWSKQRILSVSAFLIAPFIHSSMILVIAAFFFAKFLEARGARSRWPVGLLAVVAGLGLAIAIIVFGNLMLSELDDRRDLSATATRSAFYIVPWIGFIGLTYFGASGREKTNWTHTFSLTVLTFTIVCEMLGVAMFRMVAFSLPILVVSISKLTPTARHFSYLFLAAYTCVLFVYWVGI